MADLVCSVVQIAVGLCLGIAALAKASAFLLFVEGVASYRMVPRMVVGSFGGAIVVAEALIAACFLSGVLVAQAAVAASFLLIAVGVAALVARLRGIATACFCFGADGGERTRHAGYAGTAGGVPRIHGGIEPVAGATRTRANLTLSRRTSHIAVRRIAWSSQALLLRSSVSGTCGSFRRFPCEEQA